MWPLWHPKLQVFLSVDSPRVCLPIGLPISVNTLNPCAFLSLGLKLSFELLGVNLIAFCQEVNLVIISVFFMLTKAEPEVERYIYI